MSEVTINSEPSKVCSVCFNITPASKLRETGEGEACETCIESKYMSMKAKGITPLGDIKVLTDIFNANILSINSLKEEVYSDSSIPEEDKKYNFAKKLTERFEHLQTVIKDAKQTQLEAGTEQRAIQSYLNELANKLTKEKREELRLADLEYKPLPIKAPSKSKVEKPKKKYDKASIREWASKSGIPEYLLQTTCVSKDCTPEEAVFSLREAGF